VPKYYVHSGIVLGTLEGLLLLVGSNRHQTSYVRNVFRSRQLHHYTGPNGGDVANRFRHITDTYLHSSYDMKGGCRPLM
jgi:hypothetical protein